MWVASEPEPDDELVIIVVPLVETVVRLVAVVDPVVLVVPVPPVEFVVELPVV